MSDVFREVDEEVRKDQALTLWNRYGALLIGFVVLAVVATAVWQAWTFWSLNQRRADGEQFMIGLEMLANNQPGQAEAEFKALEVDAWGGYQALASLQRAAALIAAGDREAGIEVYDRLSEDRSQESTLRDLARLLAVQNLLDTADSKTISQRLAPLLETDNTWRFSALELSGLAEMRHGNLNAARITFTQLIDDPATPQGVRARAAEIVAAIGEEG